MSDEDRGWVMCPQAKECQRMSANCQKLGEKHEEDSPSQPLKGTKEPTLLTPWSWMSSPRAVRE